MFLSLHLLSATEGTKPLCPSKKHVSHEEDQTKCRCSRPRCSERHLSPAGCVQPGVRSLARQPRGRAGHLEESLGIQDSAKGRLLLYYCTGTFKTVSDTNAEREKLIHTSLCYKSCRPLNYIQFILHGYLQMHSSDLLSNHIIDRVRKEAWKNTKQT